GGFRWCWVAQVPALARGAAGSLQTSAGMTYQRVGVGLGRENDAHTTGHATLGFAVAELAHTGGTNPSNQPGSALLSQSGQLRGASTVCGCPPRIAIFGSWMCPCPPQVGQAVRTGASASI